MSKTVVVLISELKPGDKVYHHGTYLTVKSISVSYQISRRFAVDISWKENGATGYFSDGTTRIIPRELLVMYP